MVVKEQAKEIIRQRQITNRVTNCKTMNTTTELTTKLTTAKTLAARSIETSKVTKKKASVVFESDFAAPNLNVIKND